MTPISIAVLSLSLSADAFAAAIGRGAQHRPRFVEALKIGALFGVVEAITPVVGWGIGLVAAGLVERIDHWIAFVLLAGVGGRMIWEARHEREEEDAVAGAVKRGGMLALVATARQGLAMDVAYRAALGNESAAAALVTALNRLEGVQGVTLQRAAPAEG